MGYTKEIQNEYNKTYYTEHKNAITEKQSAKECCKFCGRTVRHDNIWKHTKSSYCVNRRALNKTKIAADEKAKMANINSLMINMERLYYENKLIESATRPFEHFSTV